MPTKLTTRAVDKSTLVVTVSFTDEDGNAVTPTAANWTLTDGRGNIVNDREEVAIGSLDTSVDIVLSGADLAYSAGGYRHLVLQWTYDSDAGSNLPGVDYCEFAVIDADYVS